MLSKSPIMKFDPIFLEKIWGGERIKSKLGIDYGDLPNCGELWAISGVEGKESVLSNGPLAGNNINELVEVYMGELVGDKVYNEFGNEFPLLIKFIDANDKLSIQVHPDDSLARKRGEKRGKTEMWYVLEAEENAKLISGFKRKTDPHEYRELLQANKLDEILNVEDVKNGDVFYMPAGRVHAILPGILLAEIQQTSDTTYRIYDYDRKDASGKKRDLHIEEAMDAIDFKVYDNYKTKYHAPKNQTVDLIDEKYFSTNLIYYNQAIERNIEEIDSFIIYMVVEGSLEMQASEQREKLNRGDVVLIPAITNKLNIIPKSECKLLEIYIKNEVKIGESSIELEINS